MAESQSSQPANQPGTASRLLLVLAVFLLFALLAWWMFQSRGYQLHGTALEPPLPLSDMVLVDENIDALPADLLRGRWSLVMLADAECSDVCQEQLALTQQVANQQLTSQQLTGQQGSATGQAGLQRLLVMGFQPTTAQLANLRAENPALVMAVLTRPIWTIFAVQFTRAMDAIGDAAFFLVDPNGLVVAGYDDLAEAPGVSQDLQFFQSR